MQISIIGVGYVGLVTATCLAELGHNVTCVDVVKEKIDEINRAEPPIYEEGLDDLLKKNIKRNLKATTDLNDAVMGSDISFICVGTPDKSDGSGGVDLKYIKSAAIGIGKILQETKDYHVVTVKSTVPPGTTDSLVIPLLEKYSGKKVDKDFGVCMNPEFLREGKAIHDFMNPDRIVIGESDERAGNVLYELYGGFNCPKLRVSLKTAEMIKYTSNAFLAMKVSFIGEMGNICKNLGIDVYDVANGIGYDSRIGHKFLRAGCGWGGSCFGKDVRAIIAKAREVNCKPVLLEGVIKANEKQPLRMIELLKEKIKSLTGKKVGVLGLAFKPDTDDMRESPVIPIINELLRENAVVYAYDPKAMKNAKMIFGDKIKYMDSAKQVADKSDAILVVTDWDEFKDKSLYVGKVVIDGRRVIEDTKGIDYEGICW